MDKFALVVYDGKSVDKFNNYLSDGWHIESSFVLGIRVLFILFRYKEN
jgi:hypothetical protein